MNKAFQTKFKNIFGSEADDFFQSLIREKERFFRLNHAREIDYINEELVEYGIISDELPHIFKYNKDNLDITNTISFLTGGIYIQNPSSIIPPLIMSKLLPYESIILDVSAAPGGKTTALSELTKRKSLIIANEPSASRLKSLHFNLEKYGAWNVKTISYDGRILNKKLPAIFDGILLDAPCSNENKIGYNKEVDSEWSQELVLKMQKLQMEILNSVIELLKPGGVLIYSTCTFSIEENEDIINYLIKKNNNLELVDINQGYFDKGISLDDKLNEKVIRVLPHKSRYDGFFIAGIRKKGELSLTKTGQIYPAPSYLKDFFPQKQFHGYFKMIDNLIIYEKETPDSLKKINYKKTCLTTGKLYNNKLDLASQFVWEFGKDINLNRVIDIDYKNALAFLNGFDIELKVDKGRDCLFFKNLPIGFTKNMGNFLKNKLDRYFLYGKGY
ncbi:MAG: NOL1/NOP2/sun family putative RNA methylase [Deferribacterales bacterium]